jgi:hypothetical protein
MPASAANSMTRLSAPQLTTCAAVSWPHVPGVTTAASGLLLQWAAALLSHAKPTAAASCTRAADSRLHSRASQVLTVPAASPTARRDASAQQRANICSSHAVCGGYAWHTLESNDMDLCHEYSQPASQPGLDGGPTCTCTCHPIPFYAIHPTSTHPERSATRAQAPCVA